MKVTVQLVISEAHGVLVVYFKIRWKPVAMKNQQKIPTICLSNGKLSWATPSGINSYRCEKELVPFCHFDTTKIVLAHFLHAGRIVLVVYFHLDARTKLKHFKAVTMFNFTTENRKHFFHGVYFYYIYFHKQFSYSHPSNHQLTINLMSRRIKRSQMNGFYSVNIHN